MHLGFALDGQYVKSQAFKEAIRNKLAADSDMDSEFCLPLNWDAGHFINLAVVDVRDGRKNFKDSSSSRMLQNFIKRSNIFASELKMGKGFAILEETAKKENLPMYVPVHFAEQRYVR